MGKDNVGQNRSTFAGSRFGVLTGMDENQDSVEVIRGQNATIPNPTLGILV